MHKGPDGFTAIAPDIPLGSFSWSAYVWPGSTHRRSPQRSIAGASFSICGRTIGAPKAIKPQSADMVFNDSCNTSGPLMRHPGHWCFSGQFEKV